MELVGAEHFPDEVVEDMRRYRSRGGSVKVNWILSEPPRFADPRLLHTSLALCPSIDYLERAWQEATDGRVRIVTISPEWPEAAAYIERVVGDGAVASVGRACAASIASIRA